MEEERANLMAKNYKSSESCVACGQSGEDMVCEHHLYTRKAYPEHAEKSWNKASLCLACHVEIHKTGTTAMAKKSYSFKEWLDKNGWEFCDFRKKWIRNNF